MAEAREHEPKLAALIAYDEGKLSARGRSRLQRHLDGCGACRQALAGLARYAALRSAEFERALPEVTWARVESELLVEGRRIARRARVRGIGWPLAFVAAAASALLLWHGREPSSAPPAPARPAPLARPQSPPSRPLGVQIAAIVGDVQLIAANGGRSPLAVGALPKQGEALETAAGAEVHLWLEDTAAVLLLGESRLELSELHAGQVELGLPRGQVVNRVRPQGPGRYAIVAQQHRVEVRGTHFSVAHAPDGLQVQVDEGAVAILRNAQVVAELKAPQRWSERPAAVAAAPVALRDPRQAAPGFADWPVFEVPEWPRVLQWELDGAELPATGALRMRVPLGELTVGALLGDGRRMHARIMVDAVGARFDPRELKFDAIAHSGVAAVREPDPVAAAAVLKAGQPGLQRCYERSLRNQPSGALRARLQLQLDAQGRVRQARLRSQQPVPAFLADCVRNVAAAWAFPAPGGAGVTLEAPIVFQPR